MKVSYGICIGIFLFFSQVIPINSVGYIDQLVVRYNEARQQIKAYLNVERHVRHLHYDFFLWDKVSDNLTCAMEPGPDYRFFKVPGDEVTSKFEHSKNEKIFAAIKEKRWEDAFEMIQGNPTEAMVFTQRWMECRPFNCTESYENVTLRYYYACAINPTGKLTPADFFLPEDTTTASIATLTQATPTQTTPTQATPTNTTDVQIITSNTTILESTTLWSSTKGLKTTPFSQITTTIDEFDGLIEHPLKRNGGFRKNLLSLIGFAFLMLLLLWFTIYE